MAKDPIKKAENGTYYFRANLGYHPVTGKQIQKYRSGFSTKKEARAEYSKLILASTEELADKKEDITFKKFIEEIYLPWYKTQVKESTYKNRYSTIQKHFAYFYKKKVSEIEAINVQTWQLKLAKQFSPNYVRIVQGMLCLAFDRAIILGLAKKNPARMIGNIKSKKVKIDFWTLEEFQKVISLLYKGDYYEHYLFISFWLLFMTGMRIGDADGKISLNQQKPSKHAGLRRFGPEKFLQRNNEFMKERPIFYKKPIKTEKDFSTWLRCFYYTTKAVITEYIYF